MALSAKAAKMLSRGSKADDRISRFLDLPGYDESTEMAQREVARAKAIEKAGGEYAVRYRELAKKEKEGTLTRDEKRELSSMLSPKEEKGMDRATKRFMENKGMGKAEKLSEKEKKQMQESLEFSKGGAVKKKKMMGGGMPKKYEKGGMATPLYKPNKGATYPDLFGSMGGKYTSPDNSTSSKTKGSNTNKEMYDVLPNMEEPKRKKPNPTAPSGKAKKPMMSFSKGGMANCGASMKPNGPKKGK